MGSSSGISRGCSQDALASPPTGAVVSRGSAGRATASRPGSQGLAAQKTFKLTHASVEGLGFSLRGCLTSQLDWLSPKQVIPEREGQRQGEWRTEVEQPSLYKTILEMTHQFCHILYLVGWPLSPVYSRKKGPLSSAS